MFFFKVLLAVTSACALNSENCVPTTISLNEKLRLNGQANDHDNNNVVDYSDISYDLDHNYDTNGDGGVTEQEWVQRWSCAFGDTQYLARFAFLQIGQGAVEIRKEECCHRPPFTDTGIPLDAFIAANRQRYDLFQRYQCVNTDLTMDQKLDLNLIQNNHNNDTVVDATDIAFDLNVNYDKNNDSQITESEWLLRWCCAYGDTADYARYVWRAISRGSQYITAAMFTGSPFDSGIPLATFRETNKQRYEAYLANHQDPVGR